MSSLFNFNSSTQIFSVGSTVKLYHSKTDTNANRQLSAFFEGKLFNYQYDRESKIWLNYGNSTLVADDQSRSQILFTPDPLGSPLMLKTTQGINFYRRSGDSFDLLTKSDDFFQNEFHDLYGWDEPGSILKVGRFYRDRSYVGILTNRLRYGVKFYAVIESELLAGRYPIWALVTDLSLIGDCSKADIFLSDLWGKGQESIIVRRREGLDIYEFNENNGLERLLEVPDAAKFDDSEQKLFFPYLTGQEFRDIVALNSSGLFLFKYAHEENNYQFTHYNSLFSKVNGWSTNHVESIHFADLDLNGRQDMVFTGPAGIDIVSFDNRTNECRSLLNNVPFTGPWYHSEIKAVLPEDQSQMYNPMVFMQYRNELRWANLLEGDYFIQEEFEEQNETSSRIETPVIPSLVQLPPREEKPLQLLRDKLDWSWITDSVDRDTGKPRFQLPLIDLSEEVSLLKLALRYDGNSKASDILGVGWSLPPNFIALDHQNSVFPEDEKHYVVIQGVPQQLVSDSGHSIEGLYWFNGMKNESDIHIRHSTDHERWEIKSKGIKQVFGRTEKSGTGAINLDLIWENWRGKGNSSTGLRNLVTGWYLAEVSDDDGNSIYYRYDSVDDTVPTGNKYTQEVYLKAISDNNGNELILNYSNKDRSEYKVLPAVDNDGFFNINRLQTRYLSGCTIMTQRYQQDIDFVYKVSNGKRFLTKIIQEGDITGEPIVEFIYKKMSSSDLLTNVILPTGAMVEFDYQFLGSTSAITEELGARFDLPTNYRVDYGEEDILISFRNEQGQVVLRLFNQDMTQELGSSVSSSALTRFPLLGRGLAKSHEIGRAEEFFAVVLHYSTDRELCLLRKELGEWKSAAKCYDFSENAVIRFGKDFVVVADVDSAAQLIEWHAATETWIVRTFCGQTSIHGIPVLIAAFDRMFVVYDNRRLCMGYRKEKNEWSSKVIADVPGVIQNIKETLNKFDLERETHNQLLNYFTSNALYLERNLILLNGWKLEGTQLYSMMNLFAMGSSYDVAHRQQFKVVQDDLSQFSQEMDGHDGNFFTIAYKQVEGIFKLMVKGFRGPMLDEIYQHYNKTLEQFFEDTCRNKNGCGKRYEYVREDIKKEVDKTIQEIHEKVIESLGKDFLLNPGNYTGILSSQTATCGNRKFTYIGDTWKEGTFIRNELNSVHLSIPLGDKLILSKQGTKSPLELYKQGIDGHKEGNALLNLDIRELNQTSSRNMYPIYLAYQEKDKQMSVVEFTVDGSLGNVYKLPLEEKLSPWGSYQTLVTTIEHSDTNTSCTGVFRQQLGIRRLLPNPVVTKIEIKFGNGNKRVSGFDYHSPKASGDSVYYESITTIPGNDKSSFGWVEEIRGAAVGNKVFNSQGILIATRKQEEEEPNDYDEANEGEKLYANTTLYDTTGRLEVAQFFPDELSDDEVGFYGFEDYEINRIEVQNSTSEKRWKFNETCVVKQGFSFTGENFLRLSKGILVGTFQPKNQYQEYVASSWLRSPRNSLEIDAVVPYLKAIIQAENGDEASVLLSEIKYQTRDWFYLEVIINLPYVKQIYADTQQNSTALSTNDGDMKIIVVLGPTNNTTVEIDHVRFSPLRSDFQANVYDSKVVKIKEVIRANGSVRRHIYNSHQELMASFNEYGQLVELNTHTKASSIDRVVKLRSKVKVQPESGFHEDFSPYSFQKRWTIDEPNAWQISPGQLHHSTGNSHALRLDPYEMSSASFGISLCFSLQSANAAIKLNDELKLERNGGRVELSFLDKKLVVPLSAEMLILSEHGRLFIWIDGGLYFDTFSYTSLFEWNVVGEVQIGNVLVFSEPRVLVTYLNELGEKLQEAMLEDQNSVVVKQYLYDKLGRQSITTQSIRIDRSNNQSMLAFYPSFVTNGNPFVDNSVWDSGILQGDIISTVGEYAFSQTKYFDNPLDQKSVEGFPGKNFSISGPYAKHFSHVSENVSLKTLFPVIQNYSHLVEYKPGNVEDIQVFDSKKNRVAWYVHVPKSKDLLSTYEFNDQGKVVKSLPPLYHEKVQTLLKFNSHHNTTSEEEAALQKILGTHITYDINGSEIAKTTPDSAKIENLYDETGFLRYTVYHSNNVTQDIENIIYFDYDGLGRLNDTGRLTTLAPKEQLLTLRLSSNNTEKFQQFYQSDFERVPIWRGQMRRTITYNEGEPLIEESALNADQETLSKRILIPIDDYKPLSIEINKRYTGGQLREIEYPADIKGINLRLAYSYNKLGKVTGIGLSESKTNFISYTYNSAGHIASERHSPNLAVNFTRHYSYEGPGFLTKLEDKYLTERVHYTSGGYGGHGYGDGTITQTDFKATWHANCDDRELGLNELSFVNKHISADESALCFHELKKAGYLNENNHQTKAFYPNLEPKFPIVCSYGITGRHIQATLGEKGFPAAYGHSYDYGNHQELTKAKYTVGLDMLSPLQPDTLVREIRELNSTASRDIWQSLTDAGYLIASNAKDDVSLSHSKQGKSFIRSDLWSDLISVNPNYGSYKEPLEKILINAFSQRQSLPSLKLSLLETFAQWINTGNRQQAANKILEMLETKQYFHNPLDNNFINILEKYKSLIPDVVRVLSEHIAKQLGESEFDVESYGIDANGNHKHFYTGFDRYELSYRNNTNQVTAVKFKSFASAQPEQEFSMEHDSRGNVIRAMHRGIKRIFYNPVSNRATMMTLTDGKNLTFYYDAQGERIMKRVSDSLGNTLKEVHYIRDEFGRTLVERQISYFSTDLLQDVLVTAYVYGPKGLVGFFRRDEFYSVITDHEGSTRLVIKGDEVVAAYDYLPYGHLMREYGNNPLGHISYRYTGQEYDEETGLYNYHARFYDPSIGRFYQIDPKGQYFSPYKYAGNSPISMIDPDGQFAWFLIPLIIVLGITGAYLGGAAANRNWNPAKWNWKSGHTWLGIIGGGIGGALLPVGFGASVSVFAAAGLSTITATIATSALGVAGAYISMAASNNEWDITKWDFASPETWNAAFQGFAIGSGAVGGFKMAHNFYLKLTPNGKKLFIVGSMLYGSGTFVMNGFVSGWDFKKPGVYSGLFDALAAAPDMSMFLGGTGKGLKMFTKDISKVMKFLAKNRKSISQALEIVKSMEEFWRMMQLVGAVPVVAMSIYAMGSAVNDNKIWDMTSIGTYQAMINGLLTGSQLFSFGKASIKKLGINRKIELANRPAKISNKVARDAIEIYNNVMDAKIFVNDKSFSRASIDRISVGNIPNAAMTIATTDRFMVVSFSTNKAPGLILIYSHDKLSSPILKGVSIQYNNEVVANRPVTLNDNEIRSSEILAAIKAKQAEIKTLNINNYSQEKLREIFNHDRVINEIETQFMSKGYIDKSVLISILQSTVEFKGTTHKELLKDMQTLTKERNNVLHGDNNVEELANIDRKISKKRNKLAESKKNVNDNTELIWGYMGPFIEKMTLWEPTNCAEPHAVTALSRIAEIFPDPALRYTSKDIQYLASYKLAHLPELVPFQRCDNCLITTKNVKNVVTDDYWLKAINDLKIIYERSELEFNPLKNQLFFLLPRLHMSERIAQAKNASTTTVLPDTSKQSRRNRRAVEYSPDGPISNMASSSNRMSSWISSVANWFKRSVNGLGFKDSLPEASTNTISQVTASIDGKGTLMLLDLIVRKISGQHYTSTESSAIQPLAAQALAVEITETFEKTIQQAASQCETLEQHLGIDYSELQSKILGKVLSGNFDSISDILRSYARNGQHGIQTKDHKLVFTGIDESLNEIINRTMQTVFHNEHSRDNGIQDRKCWKQHTPLTDNFSNGKQLIQ
ncbi:uncharacterized protein LOC134210946 [Armigeres subalbatus]|uniref:uncharacterized protein LOC134210946 n=1 Tax=Armigeres subalbatus TaxID=124917 RepID=UPI002ED580F7